MDLLKDLTYSIMKNFGIIGQVPVLAVTNPSFTGFHVCDRQKR